MKTEYKGDIERFHNEIYKSLRQDEVSDFLWKYLIEQDLNEEDDLEVKVGDMTYQIGMSDNELYIYGEPDENINHIEFYASFSKEEYFSVTRPKRDPLDLHDELKTGRKI